MKRKDRNIFQVIDQIRDKIPYNYEHRLVFLAKIDYIQEKAYFQPPEMEQLNWQELYQVMVTYMLPPDEEWKWEVLSIFTEKEIVQLKEEYQGD